MGSRLRFYIRETGYSPQMRREEERAGRRRDALRRRST